MALVVSRLSPYRPRIDPGPVHVRFVMDTGTGTGFSPSILVLPCQYYSINSPYSSSC
jgi:hypothetical protein